jgi:valyl-tRNA synthetase
MSKTKGNVIDPLEIIDTYGTDATRFTLAAMAAPGTDIAFNPSRTEGYRNFANKIWNAARFLFMNVARIGGANVAPFAEPGATGVPIFNPTTLEDRWILSRFNRVAKEVNDALATYRFHEAANRIYDFFWGEFCDWYLELIKPRLNSEDANTSAAACSNLVSLFEASLRLLHPVMPFITGRNLARDLRWKTAAEIDRFRSLPGSRRKSVRPCRRNQHVDPSGLDRQRPQSARGAQSRNKGQGSD